MEYPTAKVPRIILLPSYHETLHIFQQEVLRYDAMTKNFRKTDPNFGIKIKR